MAPVVALRSMVDEAEATMNLDTLRRTLTEIRSDVARLDRRQRAVRSALAVALASDMRLDPTARAMLDMIHDAMGDELPDLTMWTTVDPPTAGDIGPLDIPTERIVIAGGEGGC